jgi:hypothetical protein
MCVGDSTHNEIVDGKALTNPPGFYLHPGHSRVR